MMWKYLPPSMFAEPSSCRRYHSPRVSLAVSSLENVWVPDGKWPQKMIENVHRLRTRFAVDVPGEGGQEQRPGQRREHHVVLEHLPTGLAPHALHERLDVVPLALAAG
jgi:hypothetical protein